MLKVMTIVRTRPELTNLDVEQIRTLLLKLDRGFKNEVQLL